MGIEKSMNLASFFSQIAKSMRIEFEMTRQNKNPGIVGSNREDVVKKFLANNLPETFGISEGEIFDSSGKISAQEDVIVYDKARPVFKHNSLKFFPIESVFGVCEVKPTLERDRLEEAIKNAQIVKSMKIEGGGIQFGKFNDRVQYALFAFDGTEKNILINNLDEIYTNFEIPPEERIDVIYALDKYVFIKKCEWKMVVNGKEADAGQPLIVERGEESLLWFLAAFQSGFNLNIKKFNILKYFRPSSLP